MPCYDLLNTTIEYRKPDEEIALPLRGKKKHLTRTMLVDYFGLERCDLTSKSVEKVLETIFTSVPRWKETIGISFLSDPMKEKYVDLLDARLKTLEL